MGALILVYGRSESALEAFFRRKVVPVMEAAVHEDDLPYHPELGGLIAAWKSAHQLEVVSSWQGQEARSDQSSKAEVRRAQELERAKNSKRMTEEEVTRHEAKFVRKYPGETTGMSWRRTSFCM